MIAPLCANSSNARCISIREKEKIRNNVDNKEYVELLEDPGLIIGWVVQCFRDTTSSHYQAMQQYC